MKPLILAAVLSCILQAPEALAGGPAPDGLSMADAAELLAGARAGAARTGAPEAAAVRMGVPGASYAPGTAGSGNAPAAAGPESLSLLGQFPDPPNRNQAGAGSCHAFGSMALLEAALYRRYGRRYRLSEADVFLRRSVLDDGYYSAFRGRGGKDDGSVTEGNDVLGDIRFAIENGVPTGDQYRRFLGRYLKFRDEEVKALKSIKAQEAEMGWLERLWGDPRAHWVELQRSPESRRVQERLLGGRDPSIERQRDGMKEMLKGFQPLEATFPYLGTAVSGYSADRCRRFGSEQAKSLGRELGAGRPVAVSMELAGLRAWGMTDGSKSAAHAFVITGYRTLGDGSLVFQTRNSWGGRNPDVRAEELCRIYSAVSVRTPEEAAEAAGGPPPGAEALRRTLPAKPGPPPGKAVVVSKGMAIDTDGQVSDPANAARLEAMHDPHRQRRTALQYGTGGYLDPMALPFIVVPKKQKRLLGSFAVVEYNGRRTVAVVGDVGPAFGEGSVALAEALGIDSHGVSGGVESGVKYSIYPGAGKARWDDAASLTSALRSFSAQAGL